MSDWSSDVCSSDRQTQGALEQYAINLNERAADGRIDPLIGRDLEVERVMQTLCRRRKNNPLLVGEAGVGKTAIAEGLAWLVVEGKVPDLLKNAVVYSLDLGRSEEHTSELQSLMRISYAVFCLKKKNTKYT